MENPRTITLKSLVDATAQEVFDQVATHLLTQLEKSEDEDGTGCKYRGENGTKCAAGCLISIEEYNPLMEGHPWWMLVGEYDIPEKHSRLINELQVIHDESLVLEWKNELQELAIKEKLSTKVLEKF